MPSLRERISAGWAAYQAPAPTPVPKEVAWAITVSGMMSGSIFTPYNPSELVTRKGLKIFDAMRQDDQIKAAMSFKKAAVLSTGWQLTAPEGQPEDWDVIRFTETILKQMDGTLEDDLWEILTALEYGYSCTEKNWAPIQSGPFIGKIGLVNLKAKRPHDFEFWSDKYGNLLPDGVRQRQAGYAAVPLPRDKFVLYQYDPEFSNWYGRSDLEAAYRPWWVKDNAVKWLAMLLERLGIPPIFWKYDPKVFTGAQVEELKKVAKNLQAATFGVLPNPGGTALTETQLDEMGRTSAVFLPALEMCDKAIARALLMPGNLGLTADQQQGSYARAKVAFDVFILIVEKLRRDLEERVMMEQIIKPLVDANYQVDEYPQWSFLPMTDEVRLDILERWQGLIGSRVVSRQPGDEEQIRALLKFPEVTVPMDLDPEPLDEPQDEPDDDGMPPTRPGTRPGAPQKATAHTHEYARYDRRVDYAQISRRLDRVEAVAGDALRPLMIVVRDRLVRSVESNFPDQPNRVEGIRLSGMSDVQDVLREFLRQAYDAGTITIRAELPRKFQAGHLTPTEALRWLGQKTFWIAGVIRDRLLADAKGILLFAIKTGEVQVETLRKLRELFLPFVGDPTQIADAQVVEASRLETILRTNATDAFNQGRLVVAQDPEIAPFLRGMSYSAVIDDRTTPICRFLDGKILPMDEPELGRLTPPNHYSCRSLLVPVTLDIQIQKEDLITPSELGRAEELVQKGFK